MENGAALAFRRISPAGSTSLTIICLHGFTGSGADFGPVVEEFSCQFPHRNNTIEWLLLDLPGHGNSIAGRDPEDWQLDALLDRLDAVAALANSRRIAVLGYSMGGRIALHWLLRHPRWMGILIGASPGLAQKEDRIQRQQSDKKWIDLLLNRGINAFCQAWEQQPLIQPQTTLADPLRHEIAVRRRRNPATGLCSALRNWGTGSLPPLWDKFNQIEQLFLLYGNLDTKFAAIAAAMQQVDPRIQAAAVSACGHAPHLESPAETALAVGRILCAETEP